MHPFPVKIALFFNWLSFLTMDMHIHKFQFSSEKVMVAISILK